ncbi:Lsr2 family protein [Actinotalea ferrariae]|uniref:histone-like nucleoid-structuring protein Lsr2 n=1 Tax=Actinotalea ferrariae TaxID=1386098 RepID=UPI001C8C1B3D|nr:Lsr2 family protein [Actinotalea ferrariae]MBX9244842.1 Lsr2 family protein [Actinotalea ferrariae]
MAQKVQVVLVDDLDGGEAEETVSFALDGVSYEIDLSAENAAKLRDSFAQWVGHGRRVGGRSRSGGGARRSGGSSSGSGRASAGQSQEIREWARANGYTVNERGRIPAEVKAAFDAR